MSGKVVLRPQSWHWVLFMGIFLREQYGHPVS
jgi:hypothetical protein